MAQQGIRVHIYGEYTDKEIRKAMRDLDKLRDVNKGVGASMVAVGSKMQAMGQSVAKVGKSMTVGLTLPIVGVGVAATKMALDFDDSLTKMVSLVGLTRGEVDGMRGDIIRMASQYGKSAGEAADAMFFITSAGLRGSDAMEALEASLKGAAVGLGDVKTIADLATSAVNAYGADTLGASKATDILAAAVREGKLESSDLAGAMGQVLPVASAMGVGFDEVGAAMAAMSRTGTGASQASTQLRGILVSILKPTKQAEQALGGMGLSSEGLRQQLKEKGLLSVLQTLSERFDGNDAAAAKVFGNVRALAGVMDLMGANAGTTEEIFANMVDTTGMLDDAFNATAETTGFKLRKAFADMKNSLIEFGDVIAPFVAQFAERLSALGQAFQNLSPHTREMIVRVAAIAAAIGPVLLVIGKLMIAVGGIIKIIGLLVIAFNPVTLKIAAIVAAVALLVGAFKLAYDNSATLREAFAELMNTIRGFAQLIVSQIVTAFRMFFGEGVALRGILQTIAQVLGGVFTTVVKAATGFLKYLGSVVQIAFKIFEVGATILRMVASVIRGVLLLAFDVLMTRLGPISAAFRAVANGVRAAFTTIASAVSAAFNNVGKAVETFINFAIKAVNALIDAYNKLADVLPDVQRATRIAEFRFTSISAATNAATTATYNAASATGVNIREMERATQPTATLADLLGDLTGGYNDAAGGASKAGGATKKAGEESDKAAKKLDTFKSKFQEIADALKKAREDIERDYKAMAESVTKAIVGSLDFSDALPEVDENGERVGKTFIEKLQEQAERAVEFAARIRQLIAMGLSREAIQMVVDEGIQAGTTIADEMIGGGETYINETNRLIAATQLAADEIGIFAAEHFYGAGLKSAKETEAGFIKRFGPGGPGWNKLNAMMTALANSLNRTSVITVVTRHVTEGAPQARRFGGPVAAGTPYIVGEAGMELFVPAQNGFIVPNHDLRTSMTGQGGGIAMGQAGGNNYAITVNAGVGDPAAIGRTVVESIRAYEKRSGKVFQAA